MNRIISSFLTIVLLFSTVIYTGCNKKKDPAPEIPPESTFNMDYSVFPSASGKTGADSSLVDSSNFNHAALQVGVWNIIIGLNLIVPVLAFREAFNHEGEQTDDGVWEWSYKFGSGNLYTAALQAKQESDYINWEMYISKANDYTDVLWYSGQSKLSGKEGTWSLNKDPYNPTPFIDIEWNRDVETGTADIKYTNAIPSDSGKGGYIHYGITNDTAYNAFYDIYAKNQNNLVEIEWHKTSKEGREKDPNFYSDADYRCWDSELKNSNCN